MRLRRHDVHKGVRVRGLGLGEIPINEKVAIFYDYLVYGIISGWEFKKFFKKLAKIV